MVGPSRFVFLNEPHDIAPSTWDDATLSKLWRYNLHYFDDLNAHDARERADWHRDLLLRWVAENPPAATTGWESYPTSLRIGNWIKWSLGGNSLPRDCVESLAVQARWLSRGLEHHLLGNHLFANAKALVFAGLFFSGPEADVWLRTGIRLLEREVPEQILPDGGHFERSTMYHALALEDVLDLVNVGGLYSADLSPRCHRSVNAWRRVIPGMQQWLRAMSHPDGEIAFFNDAAIGIAPAPAELDRYGSDLGFGPPTARLGEVTHVVDSGYVRVERGGAVALIDVAPVGPDYLPAHAHADTLSFELSVFGRRVFVNSGTSCYGRDAERVRQRGTSAHNTVLVDGLDSSEVWDGFRVARRARPRDVSIRNEACIEIVASHDGYARLSGAPMHIRAWTFDNGSLVIQDRISSAFHHAQARLHLSPEVRFVGGVPLDCSSVELRLGDERTIRVTVDGGVLRAERSTWHPEFGISKPTWCLTVDFRAQEIRTRVEWQEAP